MWLCVWCGLVLGAGYSASEIILSEMYRLSEEKRIVAQHTNHRIVGGEEADIEDFPHQASFIVNNTYFCGAWFISESYLVTAGHCAEKADPKTVALRAGSSDRRSGIIIPVAKIVPHPEHDRPQFDKDVAYIKTVEPVKFSKTIQPLPLPHLNQPVTGEIVVSGWGRLQAMDLNLPTRLMKVTLPVVSHHECSIAYPGILTRNMVCGGNFFFGGVGTCQGDSGGVAVQNGTAVGIVSFGRGCGAPYAPNVFTRVPAPDILNFITKRTGVSPGVKRIQINRRLPKNNPASNNKL